MSANQLALALRVLANRITAPPPAYRPSHSLDCDDLPIVIHHVTGHYSKTTDERLLALHRFPNQGSPCSPSGLAPPPPASIR